MPDVVILLVFPANRLAQRELGILEYSPPPGAGLIACSECRRACWIGVRQMEALGANPKYLVLCPLCSIGAVRPLDKLEVGNLGGESGKFKLTNKN